jgi:L-histidine N-alpha-methyltransferase
MSAIVTTRADVSVEVHLAPDELTESMRSDVLAGLTLTPKELAPTWMYDPTGCDLFEQITALPEYYLTRAEREILYRYSESVAVLSGADTFIELGSGTSEKTLILLNALEAAGTLRHYVAFDIAEPTLREAAAGIAETYSGIKVTGVVGDFRRHTGRLPEGGRRLIAFLGSTIGNLRPSDRTQLLADLATTMEPGDTLLLGVDLVKATDRLVAAYDDAAGVTAAFNLNVLTRINRELGADFDRDRFRHVARFDLDHECIEMLLRSETDQRVTIGALGIAVDLARDEQIRTEISTKFRPDRLTGELVDVGFAPVAWWTDTAGDYAVSLSVR